MIGSNLSSRARAMGWSIAVLAIAFALAPNSAFARDCKAANNLDEVARDFVARCSLGSVDNAFPKELYGKTLGELNSGSTAAYKRAWKLVSRRIYLKSSVAPEVTPAYTHLYSPTGTANWTVTVAQDPNYAETLTFDFGDGYSEARPVPQGEGTVSLSFSKVYEIEPEGWQAGHIWQPLVFIAGGSLEGSALPDGLARTVTVSQCPG